MRNFSDLLNYIQSSFLKNQYIHHHHYCHRFCFHQYHHQFDYRHHIIINITTIIITGTFNNITINTSYIFKTINFILPSQNHYQYQVQHHHHHQHHQHHYYYHQHQPYYYASHICYCHHDGWHQYHHFYQPLQCHQLH